MKNSLSGCRNLIKFMDLMNVKKIRPETAFPKVSNLLYKLAWETTRAYNIPIEETQREVFYAFAKAVYRYNNKRQGKNDKRSSFPTLCYTISKWRLLNLVKARAEECKTRAEFKEEMMGECQPAHDITEKLHDMVKDLGEDAREIVRLVLEMPEDLIEETWMNTARTPARVLKNVSRYMRNRGVSRKSLMAARQSIKARLATHKERSGAFDYPNLDRCAIAHRL